MRCFVIGSGSPRVSLERAVNLSVERGAKVRLNELALGAGSGT